MPNPYSFVIVPTGPLEGVWMRHEHWRALDRDELVDAADDVFRVAIDHNYTDLCHDIYDPLRDKVSVKFKLADDVAWFKLTALAGMGHAAYFAYDPNKREGDEE